MSPTLEFLIWVVNGVLVIFFKSIDSLLSIALLVSLGTFVWFSPDEQRSWAVGAGVLSVVTSVIAPPPVPLFLLVMSFGGWIAFFLEKYNQPAMRWNIIRGMSLYAVAGLGFAGYKGLGLGDLAASDPQMAQGAIYLNAIIGIAMYVIPLGFLAMLAQSIWAHPPIPGGQPDQIIGTIRSRGKD